jgi:hypothetical protein
MPDGSRIDAAADSARQYSLPRILGIWVLAAVPMGILSWIARIADASGCAMPDAQGTASSPEQSNAA